jgi:hypothetical protein
MQEFAMRLNRCDHAGHDVLAREQARRFRLETRPRTRTEFAQQQPIEAGVNSQTLGNDQHDLPMGDGRTHVFGHVRRGQQRPFLVAGGTGAALLAGEGDEHLVVAVGTANSSKAFLQIAALEKGGHRLFDVERASGWQRHHTV